MKISTFKSHLAELTQIQFELPTGQLVPAHFHITEAGITTKNFVDCGGTVREEKNVSFQVWVAQDTEHRLHTSKLLSIIAIAERMFGSNDHEVEVEYQSETISRYGLTFQNGVFVFVPKQTDCLAKDNCGIPAEKLKVNLSELAQAKAVCTPGGNCC